MYLVSFAFAKLLLFTNKLEVYVEDASNMIFLR